MHSAVSSFPAQISRCREQLADSHIQSRLDALSEKNLKRVTVCALGGSAFPMEMLRSWLREDLTIEIHRDYSDQLPQMRNDTLYIVLSFSGNTEEVLDCVRSLSRDGASLFLVTNGGKLSEFAQERDLLQIGFPDLADGFQPRCATGYFLGFVSGVLDRVGLSDGVFERIEESCLTLESKRVEVEAQAKVVAQGMYQQSTFILGYPELADTVGRIGRIKFNENAKVQVICDSLPEFNHNQMMSMTLGGEPGTAVLLLSDWRTVGRRRHRVEVCDRYFRDRGARVINLVLFGYDMYTSVLYGTWLLDFASLHLARLRGVDPQEIGTIESFKRELGSDFSD